MHDIIKCEGICNNNSNNNLSTQTSDNTGLWAIIENIGHTETIVHHVLLLVAIVTIVSDSIALYIVNQGKKFPRFCRLLSLNYLVSDLLGAVSFALHQVLLYSCGYNYDLLMMTRVMSTGVTILTSGASIVCISFERVMALVNDLTHRAPSSSIRIAAIITTIWVFNAGVILITILVKLQTDCQWGLNKCYLFYVFTLPRFVGLTLLLIYDILLIFANLIIQHFVRRHKKQIKEQQYLAMRRPNSSKRSVLSREEYDTWKTVAQIMMSYLLLHIPMTISFSLYEAFEHTRRYIPLTLLGFIGYLCMQISSFVHLYLYVFKLKENKLNLFILLSRVFQRFEQLTEELRRDVYNIPISANRRQTRPSTQTELHHSSNSV